MSAQFCISIDLELAWGVWDTLTPVYLRACLDKERAISKRLVALFDELEIPVTWAIVARLLRARTDVANDELPAWYAPDVIERIRAAKTPHDIGSHSFAHPSYASISRDEALADLRAAREVHAAHGLPFDSWVFPRNQIGHVDALAAAGVRVYRSVDAGWHQRFRGTRIGRAAHLASQAIPIAPATVTVRSHDGLAESPSSMLLMGRGGVRGLLPPRLVGYRASRALAASVRRGELFHLWFHPSNFYDDAETQFGVLRKILSSAAEHRRRGELAIVTMRDLVAA